VSKKVIFLDRDGVINQEVSYLHKIENFKFIEGIFNSLRIIQDLGYYFIVITNQSGIGRGLYSEKDYLLLDKWMKKEFEKNGVRILYSIHCPHTPEQKCDCRKPKPGMFINCFKLFQISKDDSWMVGDSERDIEAAIMAGITNNILVRSGHPISETTTKASIVIDSIKDITNIIKS